MEDDDTDGKEAEEADAKQMPRQAEEADVKKMPRRSQRSNRGVPPNRL
jgi:hypothetical protein